MVKTNGITRKVYIAVSPSVRFPFFARNATMLSGSKKSTFPMIRNLISILLFFCLWSVKATESETNLFFPLMAWNWAPSDKAVLQKMRDCGLTVAGFVAPKDLDLCQSAGLKAIVSDPRTSNYDFKKVDEAAARKNIASLVAEVGNHPAVY